MLDQSVPANYALKRAEEETPPTGSTVQSTLDCIQQSPPQARHSGGPEQMQSAYLPLRFPLWDPTHMPNISKTSGLHDLILDKLLRKQIKS